MARVFLLGGGGDHPERNATFGRFLDAAGGPDGARLALIAVAQTADEAKETLKEIRAVFKKLGLGRAARREIALRPGDTLTADRLGTPPPTGVFVCGGLTPLYQEVLCADRAWLEVLEDGNVPYGGLSAGAAIAAARAIVGGWQARRDSEVRPIVYEGAGEGLDLLEVRPGLGLVPFSVDVHASQWGTLTRALQAVDLGLADEVWAVDEATLLEVDGAAVRVAGAGQAYHLVRSPLGGAQVSVHVPESEQAAAG